MGSTKLVQRGVNPKSLTDKERRFCYEYSIDYNGTRAATAAGYSAKTAQVQAVHLLKKDHIKKFIGKLDRIALEKCQLKKHDVIEQLAHCVLRTTDDFKDEEGKIQTDLNKLNRRAQCSVDAIEQEVYVSKDREGNIIGETIKTKLRLVPKAHAIDMAMKHLGAYAAEKIASTHVLNFDQLFGEALNEPDEIERRIEQEQTKRLTGPEQV